MTKPQQHPTPQEIDAMTPDEIFEAACVDGIIFVVHPTQTIFATFGDEEAYARWETMLRRNKGALLNVARRKIREAAQGITVLAEQPVGEDRNLH